MNTPATPVATAGSRRFWITVVCFALANTLCWIGYHRFISCRPPLLRVESFAPADGTNAGCRPTICWQFNMDVVKPGAKEPPAFFCPALAGNWMWSNPRTLLFLPAGDLPRETRFTVTLPAERLRSSEGFRLAKTFVSSFTSEPLLLQDIRQVAFDDQDRLVLELCFNDKVVPEEVLKHLKLARPDDKPLNFQLVGDAAGPIVRIQTEALPSATAGSAEEFIKVNLAEGLRGACGPLAMDAMPTRLVSVGTHLMATGARPDWDGDNDPGLHIEFNQERTGGDSRGGADLDALEKVISVEPAVPFKLVGNSDGVDLRGAFQPATRYTIRLAKPPAGADLRKYPRGGVLSVFIPDRPCRLWIEHGEGYLGSKGNRTLLAHATNYFQLNVTISRVYDNNLVQWRNSNATNYPEQVSQIIVSKKIELPKVKNKPQDVRLCLDDLLPEGGEHEGVYCIALSAEDTPVPQADENGYPIYYRRYHSRHRNYDEDGDSNRAIVTLSDIGLTAKRTGDGLVAWAVSLSKAQPIAGTHLRLYSNKNQLLGEARTDSNGLARIESINCARGESAALLLADTAPAEAGAGGSNLTWLALAEDNQLDTSNFDSSGRDYLREGYEAFIYTERGVYRPGETVHLRGIVRGGEGVGTPHFPVRWRICRPDLRDWQCQVAKLDADGSAGWDLPLPDDLSVGRWTAQLEIPGDKPEGNKSADASTAALLGTASFQIEEFIPNRMKVSLALSQTAPAANKPTTAAGTRGEGAAPAPATPGEGPDEGRGSDRFALANGPVVAKVQADYLFGRPVTERPAELSVRVDPSNMSGVKWTGWTFSDSANTLATLAGPQALGHRLELKEQTLDDNGSAGWDLDGPTLFPAEPEGQHSTPGRLRRNLEATPPSRWASTQAATQPAAPPPNLNGQFVGPWRITLAATVTETGGRAIVAGRTLELDTVPYYLALGPLPMSVPPGTATNVEVAMVRPDGKIAAQDQPVELTLFRDSWNNALVLENGRYHYQSTRILEPVPEQSRRVILRAGHASCPITTPGQGQFVLRVRDLETNGIASRSFYATNAQQGWEDSISREHPDRLELIVLPMPKAPITSADLAAAIRQRDRRALQRLADQIWANAALSLPHAETAETAGIDGSALGKSAPAFGADDQAQIIVRSPFAGKLLLTLETDHVISTQVIDMPASHMAVGLAITAACRPNAFVTASVVRPIDPNAKWRTHRAFGASRIAFANGDRKLNVQIATPTEIRPLQSLGIEVRLSDAAGNPCPNTAVTVSAVDEGICMLTGFRTPDPFAFFTQPRALGVGWWDIYTLLMPEVAKPDPVSAIGGDGGEEDVDSSRHQTPVTARRVRSAAMATGVLHTDDHGLAHADFPIPEFSGQLRISAVAFGQKSFGAGDKPTLVRSPLLVQSSWPRFAAPGDVFTVPLAVFNNSPVAATAQITIDLPDDAGAANPLGVAPHHDANATTVPATASRTITLPPILLPAGGQASVGFDIAVAQLAGVGHARLMARMNNEAFQESVELPIRPASPAISTGGYAVARPDAPCKVSVPAGSLPGTERFILGVGRRPTLDLPQGLDYLERYPYGCAEQTISTCFPLVYLSDIGQEIAPGVFDKERVDCKVQTGILRLIGMQHADGGIGMWSGSGLAWPWASVYGAHFLVEAQAAGHAVPEDFRASLFNYLHGLLKANNDDTYSIELQAYACYVLALAGKPERSTMNRLSEVMAAVKPATQPGYLIDGVMHGPSDQARLHLAAAWLAAGRRDLAAGLIPHVLPTPRSQRQNFGNVGSPIRDRAMVINTLLAVQPDHPELPALAQQLADAGRKGQWRSTQDTAFAVMALGHYLKLTHGEKPYDGAQLLLDGVPVASATTGTIDFSAANAPNANGPATRPIAAGSQFELRITGPEGAKAHLSWLHTGVPLITPPDSDQGMKVRRRYLNANGDELTAATIRSGDLVQVELTIESFANLENIVIDDLLPAGLEVENTNLNNTADLSMVNQKPRPGEREPARFSVRHVEARDDRCVIVGDYFSGATAAKYVYLTRAVTPGIYAVPPVRAECMYDIGTNSLWAGTQKTLQVTSATSSTVARTGND